MSDSCDANYEWFSGAVIRYAALSAEDLFPDLKENAEKELYLAIENASPSLIEAIRREEAFDSLSPKAEKVRLAFYKYRLRAAFRSIPFAGFSTVSRIAFGAETRLDDCISPGQPVYKTDFYNRYRQLCDNARDEPQKFRWRINPDFYQIGPYFRTIEMLVAEGKSWTALREGAVKDLLEDISLSRFISYSGLVVRLRSKEIPESEIQGLLSLLIGGNFLIPERNKAHEKVVEVFSHQETYSKSAQISYSVVERVVKAVDVLGSYFVRERDSLESLRLAILRKWGEGRYPCLKVFDIESGFTIDGRPRELLGDFLSQYKSQDCSPSIVRNPKVEDILNKCGEQKSIDLSQFDIQEEKQSSVSLACLPEDLSAIFSLGSCTDNDDDEREIWLRTVAGPNANRLISQYALHGSDIEHLVREISEATMQREPDALHAEVLFLSASSAGCTLERECCYSYHLRVDVPVHGEHEMSISDLSIEVSGESLKLWNHKLHRYIVPHFSHPLSVDNQFTPDPLRFLARYSTAGNFQSFRWLWNYEGSRRSWPRVHWKNVILCPAQWVIRLSDLADPSTSSLREILDHLSIPNHIFMCCGFDPSETPLPLILEDDPSMKVLLDQLGKSEMVLLSEREADYIPVGGRARSHDIILPLKKRKSPSGITKVRRFESSFVNSAISESKTAPCPEASYLLTGGDRDWISFHIYCMPLSVDRFLSTIIYDMVNHFLGKGWIKNWHFVREYDGDHHIRIRFQYSGENSIRDCIYLHSSSIFRQCTEKQNIFGWELKEYVPEVERYGGRFGINTVYGYFTLDSQRSIKFLRSASHNLTDRQRVLYHSILAASLWQKVSSETGEKGETYAQSMMSRITPEAHQMAIGLSGDLYREQMSRKKSLGRIFVSAPEDRLFVGRRLSQKVETLFNLEQKGVLEREWIDILDSLIHMTANRIFRCSQRKHEAVSYHLVGRLLRARRYVRGAI
ncbi:thiopeptide-type bacteriocin biosynthesis domain-containing protein [Rubritalea squalenifaciens DSM 18772]|uniref:Thiopeptide-type bacteriocin biosynthesis domain-containing protein n=1 Tax=Rubritalea squalenifaciens DSM 18772 TaxID=1123071 RepID=A0A1M6GP47_9BACT|nr:lantibiotic dehydratase [Rubritalea squalenifaciens]SHJ11765.1 thiopeptide-type bacteriocin biosynthesis domain-containing protein [Rubritalea squalenifaciens DSM 18772]